jgi:hypothetical protein
VNDVKKSFSMAETEVIAKEMGWRSLLPDLRTDLIRLVAQMMCSGK